MSAQLPPQYPCHPLTDAKGDTDGHVPAVVELDCQHVAHVHQKRSQDFAADQQLPVPPAQRSMCACLCASEVRPEAWHETSQWEAF